ncbi:MAG: hypothetical protein RJA31_944 [Actinomycetota bacterium]
MVSSNALTVDEYIAELPADRAEAVTALVDLVRAHIQPGYVETMRWGMISYEIPLEISGPTYNQQPLNYVAIASQKNHLSVYLMGIYAVPGADAEFSRRWAESGKRLDMGKACVRFTSLDKADLPTIAWAVGLVSVDEYLATVRAHGKV